MAQQDDPRQLGRYFALAQVGVEMVVPIVLGIWLDGLWNTGPWLLVVGACVGFVGGLYHMIVLLRPAADERNQHREPPAPP